MAGPDKVVNLVVKARDEYSRVLNGAKVALDKVSAAQKASAYKAALAPLIRQYTELTDEVTRYKDALDAGQKSGRLSRAEIKELGETIGLTTQRAREAKAALDAKRVALTGAGVAARGSYTQFDKAAQSMRVEAEAADRLRQKLANLRAEQQATTARIASLTEAQKTAPGMTNRMNADLAINKARMLKNDIRGVEIELARLDGAATGSFKAMDQVAIAMAQQSNAAESLAPDLKQAATATNVFAAAQTRAAAAAQRNNRMMTGANRAGFDQGGRRGERQDVTMFGLKPWQLTNLAYQGNDIISGLAMGQNPTQILAQQLGQVLQIFPSFTKLFFTGAPIIAAFAAVLSPVIANIVALNREAASVEMFASKLALMADGGRYSAEALADVVEAVRDLGATTEEARDIVSGFVENGIRPDRMKEFAQVVSEVAKATGQELPDAASAMTAAFTGGFEALREYDKEANVFSAAQLATIRALYDAGDAAGAQEAAFDALQSKLTKVSDGASGPWSQAAKTFGEAWGSLVDLFKDSLVLDIVLGAFNAIGKSVTGVAMAFRDFINLVNSAATSTPVEDLATLQQMLAETQDRIDGGANGTSMDALTARRDALQAQISALQAEIAASAPTTPNGLTVPQQGTEEYAKNQQDFVAALQQATAERQRSAQAIGLEGEALSRLTARQEAEAQAREAGLDVTDAAVQAAIQGYVDVAEAVTRQEANVKALSDAEATAAGFVAEHTSEQDKQSAVIRETEAALSLLTAVYGQFDPRVQAAASALARYKSEAATAKSESYALAAAANALSQALASLGTFQAGIDNQIAVARRRIEMVQQGYDEARINATESVTAALREEIDTMIAAGYSFEAVAAKQQELIDQQAEANRLTEEAARLTRDTFAAADAGGGSPGGSDGETPQELAEKRVNDLLANRKALLERIQYLSDNGQTEAADELRQTLAGVNAELTQAIDANIQLLQTMSGADAQAAILAMQQLRDEIGQVTEKGKEFLPSVEDVNDSLSDIGVNALDTVAQGGNIFDALSESIGQFLIDIGLAIAKQALFNALTGGTGGGVGGTVSSAIASLFHTGGIAGQQAVRRSINTDAFIGAVRYHTGGIAGLQPNEVPAILKAGEEVLTADDPRHIANGGKGKNGDVKIVNVFDPADMMEKALASDAGQRVLLNWVNRNRRTVGGLLNG